MNGKEEDIKSNMTDEEFDVLDELYFLQSFTYLLNEIGMKEDKLKSTLVDLCEKGWVKSYSSPTEQVVFERSNFEESFANYYYLASKAGLMAHNSNF